MSGREQGYIQQVFVSNWIAPLGAAGGRVRGGVRRRGRRAVRARAQIHHGRAAAEALFWNGLCLPSGTALTEADLDRVVSVIRATRR